ncbi:MAG: RelA/SpoT domain-containing protein [Candidatus Aenigmarchaeota archaeon]|nr:RelA/SpoT domain-containing protein [Candidatus Aenigmarchaeota archaeon]
MSATVKKFEMPSIEDIERYIKSELGRIKARDYSANEIYECVRVYRDLEIFYHNLIEAFSLQIQTADEISEFVHSVRFRTKDPYHLVYKLVRRCLGLDDKKPHNITPFDLLDPEVGITDLGGVRILHLRANDWEYIHDYLVAPGNMPSLSIEKKIAYVKPEKKLEYTKGNRFYLDDKDLNKSEIKYDDKQEYTSLHYIFKSNYPHPSGTLYFECQVRTLFEEGWGEIDHQMNYPDKANSIIRGYLSLLNSSAHTANTIAAKLETLEYIPLYITWETELRTERSADRIYCITPDLKWVAENLDKSINNVKDSEGTFHYFILSDDNDTKQNITKVEKRLKAEGLWKVKVWLHHLSGDKSVVPVIADLLLLENAVHPITHKQCPISVVGVPAQKEVSQEEHLDMLITEESAIKRMKKFFENLL